MNVTGLLRRLQVKIENIYLFKILIKKHENVFKSWLCPNFLLLPKKSELPKIWGDCNPPRPSGPYAYEYESHQHVSKISATDDAILSNRNPGSVGTFFDEQYVHIPSDQLLLRGNVQKLGKVQEEVEKEEQDIKDHLNSLYSMSGKLKDGKGSQRDFDEERITVLTMLRKKIIQNIQHLQDAENKLACEQALGSGSRSQATSAVERRPQMSVHRPFVPL